VTGYAIELREPGKQPRLIEVTGALTFGRECDGVICDDPEMSRQHLVLRAIDGELVVEDLGSLNGTSVNGVTIAGPTALQPGDVIRAGSVDVAILAPLTAPALPAREGAPVVAATPAVAATPGHQPPRDLRPALDELTAREVEGAVIRFRPGTAGERAAPAVGTAARRARRRLAGLGSEAWGALPQICLVDPFPDPTRPGEMFTSGTIVDAARDEIWMVVTPESPPEPLERPMALLFGLALPAGRELGVLLEGWGLHRGDTPDPTPDLRKIPLPPMAMAGGELRGAMALSFVKYLLERGGEREFRRLLAARPGQVDETAHAIYGRSMAALEESWQRTIAAGSAEDVKTRAFIRLALRYLRPHKWRELEILVHAALGMAFTAVMPFAIKRLIDSALPTAVRTRHFSPIASVLVMLAVAAVVSWGSGLRSAYLSAYVSSSIVRDVRVQMFERLQRLSAAWFGRRQQGDVLSRMFNDVQLLEQGLSQTLMQGVTQSVALIVQAAILVRLNARLAVIVLVGAPLVALVYRLMARGAQKRSIAVQEETGAAFAVAAENYSGLQVVRAFALEAREIARFRRAHNQLFKRGLNLHLYTNVFGVLVQVVVTALQMAILGYGAYLIIHGQLTVGALMAFVSVMGTVISPVTALSSITQLIQQSSGALVRINEILDVDPDILDAPDAQPLPPLQEAIQLSSVSFSYTMERRTLDDINLTIPAGRRVAFVGPTGAGKSSVLGLLQRAYDPDDGSLLFDGVDIRHVTLASLRGQIGMVFQESFLFDATVRENIRMGNPDATDADIEAAGRAAELHDFVMTLPRGYDTLVGERGGRFSGGQRQRLAIARALVRDPRVLLLDEATSALDPRTERLIADTLDRVSHGRTTIAVTHRLTSITDYDRIFVLDDGHLVEAGTHDELVRQGRVYAMLWAEQTGAAPPVEAPFDAVAALARVPLFAGLAPHQLADVAARLQAGELAPGQRLAEGGGRLVLLRRGRCRVLVPALGSELATVAELGAGDVFGMSALLGQERGAMLEALDQTSLLVLDQMAISDTAVRFPTVGDALTGRRKPRATPAGGQRLERLSVRLERPEALSVPKRDG